MGVWLRTKLDSRTIDDHITKCRYRIPEEQECVHMKSGSLACALAISNGLIVGNRRARLYLTCPYSTEDPTEQIAMLHKLAQRIRVFALNERKQVLEALERIAKEILAFANRNPMQVIADAAR